MTKHHIAGIVVGAAFLCAVPVSVQWSAQDGPTLATDSAQARIGRPLTPGSVAGVNRRVHRRAYRQYHYHNGHGTYY